MIPQKHKVENTQKLLMKKIGKDKGISNLYFLRANSKNKTSRF